MVKLLLNPLIYALRMQHIRNSVLDCLSSFLHLCAGLIICRRSSLIPNKQISIGESTIHRQFPSKDSYTIFNEQLMNHVN